MSTFDLCLTQTESDRSRFVALGAKPARCFGNLKYAGKPLLHDEDVLAEMRQKIGKRPVWIFASTHRGEEVIATETHKKLREQWPELLTIIVPRHVRRGDEIVKQLALEGCPFARRSKDDPLTAKTEIYLADTMGELGLFYRLSPIMVMGGTFVPVGGHNLIEPAQLNCAIIVGPYIHTQSEVASELIRREGAVPLRHSNELHFTLDRLLRSQDARDRTAYAAYMLASEKRNVLDQVMKALAPWLEKNWKPGVI